MQCFLRCEHNSRVLGSFRRPRSSACTRAPAASAARRLHPTGCPGARLPPASARGARGLPTVTAASKPSPGPRVIPGTFASSHGAPVSSRSRSRSRARAPPAGISPPSPNNGERRHHGRARGAAATYRLQARGCGGGSCSCSATKPPPLPGRDEARSEQSPRALELAANHLSVRTTSSLCLYRQNGGGRERRSGPGGATANQNTPTRARPMTREPPPVAGRLGRLTEVVLPRV